MLRFLALISILQNALSFCSNLRPSSVPTQLMAERSKSIPFLLKPSKLDGTLAGDEGFDPLGLSNINDLGIDLYWLREAEIKHARVAMLAVVGLLSQELGFTVPGFPTGKNQVELFWTIVDQRPGPVFSAFLFLGLVEVISGFAITEGRKNGDRAPGDFSFNPLKFGSSEASKKDLAMKEIRNGRLAMWAAAGILLQGSVSGGSALENLGF